MRFKALSGYGDKTVTYGDCFLLYTDTVLIVYDCGHTKHADAVIRFLQSMPRVAKINIIASHGHRDHTGGICDLFEKLHDDYVVEVYLPLYLKLSKGVHDELNDGRRKPHKTKEHIVEAFSEIDRLHDKSKEHGITIKDATKGTQIAQECTIVGPKKDDIVVVVAKAVEDDTASIDGETVMNAASVQLKCILDGNKSLLLCGDATPEYLPDNLDDYDIIHLPHHGRLDNAMSVFDDLTDSHSKTYIVSDNTNNTVTSGGSDALVKYMKDENYAAALNTKDGDIDFTSAGKITQVSKRRSVPLGDINDLADMRS